MYRLVRKLVLASASPRRRSLLAELGLDLEVCPARIDETPGKGEEPGLYAARMAREKCSAVIKMRPEEWVLAADTVVSVDGILLGKPASRRHAVETLMRLSGREHQVVTGFALGCRSLDRLVEQTVTTRVRFTAFSAAEAACYAATGEPDDKAGAYGIQGKGGVFVKEICGSYSNVVGLPLAEVLASLSKYGIVKTK